MQVVKKWWNGLSAVARMIQVPKVGITTCPVFLAWSMVKGPWQISSGFTIVHHQARTSFVACLLALDAATLLAMTALRGINCMLPCAQAVMATTEVLVVCRPSPLWATRDNIGQPASSTAHRRCIFCHWRLGWHGWLLGYQWRTAQHCGLWLG